MIVILSLYVLRCSIIIPREIGYFSYHGGCSGMLAGSATVYTFWIALFNAMSIIIEKVSVVIWRLATTCIQWYGSDGTILYGDGWWDSTRHRTCNIESKHIKAFITIMTIVFSSRTSIQYRAKYRASPPYFTPYLATPSSLFGVSLYPCKTIIRAVTVSPGHKWIEMAYWT